MTKRIRPIGYAAKQARLLKRRYNQRRERCECVWCREKVYYRALCDECRQLNNCRAREARSNGKGVANDDV